MDPWIRTYVKGVTYQNLDWSSRQDIIKGCKQGDKLTLVREPDNQYDGNAVKVCVISEEKSGFLSKILGPKVVARQLGYLSKYVASKLAPLMDKGIPVHVEVREIRQAERAEIILSGAMKEGFSECLVEITAENIQWDEERNPMPVLSR